MLFAIVVVCLLLLYISIKINGNYWKKRNIPFEPPLPLIGNLLDALLLRKNAGIILSDLYRKFSNEAFFGIWMFNVPHLVIRNPELVNHILIKDFDNFADRNVHSNENVDALSASMLFFSRNPKWKRMRSITSPLFTTSKVKYVCPQTQLTAKKMVTYIKERNFRSLGAKDIAGKFSTDSICSMAFGIDAHSFQDNSTPFTNFVKKVMELSLRNSIVAATYFCRNPIGNILRLKLIPKAEANFITDTCLTILKQREDVKSARRDLIEVLIKLKNQHNLQDYEIAGEAAEFLLAGYETTSSAISYTLYELAFNKHIQTKLREEVNAVKDDNDDELYITLNDTKTLLHRVMLESLRKYPPLPFLGRESARDYTIPGTNIIIDKGTPILIPLIGLHHDPEYFPEPQRFDPERFSEENMKLTHPCCYLPFGDGHRHCIGQRIGALSTKMALLYIVKNFEIEPSDDTPYPLRISPRSFSLQAEPFDLIFKTIN